MPTFRHAPFIRRALGSLRRQTFQDWELVIVDDNSDFLRLLSRQDLLMITADHGCDPDPRWETTDHSREYVPIIAYSPGGATVNLGTRSTLADMGQTIAENFGLKIEDGVGFLDQIS